MKQHAESHLDHSLTPEQVAHILERFADREAFFLETIELPEALGTVPCGLHGPLTGGAPVPENAIFYAKRGTRKWRSRLISLPPQQVRTVTVIGGPHEEPCKHCDGTGSTFSMTLADSGHGDGYTTCHLCHGTGKISHSCILFTAYGGPPAPPEPGDIRLQMEAVEQERRERFARGEPDPSNGCSDLELRAKLDPLYGKLAVLRVKRAEADACWAVHALSAPSS